jgi:hypothetical protein
METAHLTFQSTPRPEHAQRAIWAGRAARSREAASTDRGWASTLVLALTLTLSVSIGHATIPPGLRPFLARTAPVEEPQRRDDSAMDAEFAKINDAIGEDVQEIDPDVGVGNASKYVGPALVPDGAKGRAFTAKVKIAEGKAKSDRPPAPANDGGGAERDRDREDETTLDRAPPSSRGGLRLGGRTARLMAQAGAEHAPPVSVPESDKGASDVGRSRGLAIAVAIGALGVVVMVALWVVRKGPEPQGAHVPPALTVSVAPAVPAVDSSGAAVVAAPTAPSPAPLGASQADAGASVAPSVPTAIAPAPYTPKKRGPTDDPYDAAAPAPATTVEPIAPPPTTTTPPIPPIPVTAAPSALPKAPPPASSGRILGSDEG